MRIEYKEVDFQTVLNHFANGFKPRKDGESIFNHEAFFDPVKSKVIFRLSIREKEDREVK